MSALVLHLLFALQALLRNSKPPSTREREIAAQHEAAYRALVREQLCVVWTPASGGDA